MSAPYTPDMGARITELLTTWKLTTAAAELVPRLNAAGHDEALALPATLIVAVQCLRFAPPPVDRHRPRAGR